MFPSVLAAFTPLSESLEGRVPHLYVDIEGFVTTAIGNKVDPVENALALTWFRPDGSVASAQEVKDAWSTVKHSGKERVGGGNQADLTTIRLDEAGIEQAMSQKLTDNESILKRRIPGWNSLPADAQLAILSMAWAMGADFRFPKFLAAINKTIPDFETAARESYMNDNPQKSLDFPPISNPGLRPRNLANRQLLFNAQKAIDAGTPNNLSMSVASLLQLAHSGLSSAASSVASGARSAATPAGNIIGITAGLSITAAGLWWLARQFGGGK